MHLNHKITNKPVSYTLICVLLIIYILYVIKYIKKIQCNNILSVLGTNFVHTNIYHILINLFALYIFSDIEQQLGSFNFLYLICFILIFNTLVQYYFKKSCNISCINGFSGVLYGFVIYYFIVFKKLNIEMIIIILGMLIIPIYNKSPSIITSYIINIISGLISGFLWKYYKKIYYYFNESKIK